MNRLTLGQSSGRRRRLSRRPQTVQCRQSVRARTLGGTAIQVSSLVLVAMSVGFILVAEYAPPSALVDCGDEEYGCEE